MSWRQPTIHSWRFWMFPWNSLFCQWEHLLDLPENEKFPFRRPPKKRSGNTWACTASQRIIKVISILISAVGRLINRATCEIAGKTRQRRRERGRKWSDKGVFGSRNVPRRWKSGIRVRNVSNIRPLNAETSLATLCDRVCVRSRLYYCLFRQNAGLTFADNSKAWNFLQDFFCGAFKILNGIVSFEFQRMRQHNYNLSLLLWMNFFKFMIAWGKARRRQRRSERGSWVWSTMKQLIPENKKNRGTWSERRLARAAKKKRSHQKNISCLECVNKSVIFSGIRNL